MSLHGSCRLAGSPTLRTYEYLQQSSRLDRASPAQAGAELWSEGCGLPNSSRCTPHAQLRPAPSATCPLPAAVLVCCLHLYEWVKTHVFSRPFCLLPPVSLRRLACAAPPPLPILAVPCEFAKVGRGLFSADQSGPFWEGPMYQQVPCSWRPSVIVQSLHYLPLALLMASSSTCYTATRELCKPGVYMFLRSACGSFTEKCEDLWRLTFAGK